MSPYVAGAMNDLPALQQKLLHWLRQRQDLGMVPATEIARWKAFFEKVPAVATSTFPFAFPHTGELLATASSLSSSAQLLCLPSGVSAERQSALLSIRGIVSAEQLGPLVEPIPYPGYSAKERDRKVNAARGLNGADRGERERGRGRGRGRARGCAAEGNVAKAEDPLAVLLAEAPDTELDMFYPSEIVRERFLYDSGTPQRQHEVTWSPSVTSMHKNAAFQKSRVERIRSESSDGKHALVEWRNTWEKADAWDERMHRTRRQDPDVPAWLRPGGGRGI